METKFWRANIGNTTALLMAALPAALLGRPESHLQLADQQILPLIERFDCQARA